MKTSVATVPFMVLSHLLAIGAAFMVLVWCIHFRGGLAFESTNKSLIFNIHPVLMLIGIIILGGEAIISYKAIPLSKEVKKVIHLILHFFAFILGIVGIYAAYKYHNESSIANFFTLHSWLGIGVICLCYTASCRAKSLPWHGLFGLFVYLLAVATATLGFLEKLTFLEFGGLAKYGSEAFLINFTAIVTILFGGSIVLIAVSPAPVEDVQFLDSSKNHI
ncbi:probable ascorbate-specific transmembrane electron transporter 1 [Telopea speciosissima]|uniref:probable ascorbate-specific transmembrane electron transporter 1 n=1 Tax=Telopea speciosissima TaxID=54955 RepID=UPI001CC70595|nr:probable ascorbate-specific transmembrane electron transporter 1 [Telopea speciosissima]